MPSRRGRFLANGAALQMISLADELASEYDARVRIGKVNIDEEQALAAQYGIRASPPCFFSKTARWPRKLSACAPNET